MAVSSKTIFLFLILFGCSLNAIEAGFGTRLGGKKEIKDVESNKEIQELGSYCVDKYNLKPQNEIGTLKFLKVVKAESQVVSGIKYYLKISAVSSSAVQGTDPASAKKGGQQKTFDAVVVVKSWVPSKELVEFAPSTQ